MFDISFPAGMFIMVEAVLLPVVHTEPYSMTTDDERPLILYRPTLPLLHYHSILHLYYWYAYNFSPSAENLRDK